MLADGRSDRMSDRISNEFVSSCSPLQKQQYSFVYAGHVFSNETFPMNANILEMMKGP